MSDWKAPFERGMACGQSSDFAGAEAAFREAVALAPDEPYPHYELGYTLFLVGRMNEALEEFQKTDALSCGFFLVQTEAWMCQQFLSGGIDAEILEWLRKLQQYTDTGLAQSMQTLTLARKVVERAPECAMGHFYLGKAQLERAPHIARQSLKRCVELSPDDTTAIDAKFHLGVLARGKGDEEGAAEIWRQVLLDYPRNPHCKMVQMLLPGPQ